MIGCGFVGSASVFALMQSGLFTEIVLSDADKDKADGEAMDISHGIPFASPMKIYAGDIMYRDLNGDGKISKGASTLDDHGDLKVIGNSTPRYFFGIDLNADWKGFDVRLFFQGVMKRDYWGKDNFCGYLFGARGDKDMWHARGLVEHQDYFRAQAIGIDGHELPANLDAYYPRPVFKEGAKNQETQSRYLQNSLIISMS